MGKVEPVEMAALAAGASAGAAVLMKLLERVTNEEDGEEFEKRPG